MLAQAGHTTWCGPTHLELPAALHHVVVHQCVVPVELDVVSKVVEQATDEGGEVDDVRRAHALEQGAGGFGIPAVRQST